MSKILLLHTPGHRACPACRAKMETLMHPDALGSASFSVAASTWLESRKRLCSNTKNIYAHYIASLNTFFGDLTLRDIHAGHIAEYQSYRQTQIRLTKQHAHRKHGLPEEASDGASAINHEISCVLRQVLKQAGLWLAIQPHYEPLPIPQDEAGMALTEEEERHLFRVARSRKRWMIAYCCDLLSRNTTAGPGELRHLRLQDVDVAGRVLHVEEGLKNVFRKRPLPMNDDALWAAEYLLRRYRSALLRANLPEDPSHYILYHRAHRRDALPEFDHPMGSWQKAHYAIRLEAAKKFPRLARLRRYDFRHTACTELLANPSVSYATIEHLMGHHLGSTTKRKYDHLRNASLRAATEALNRDRAPLWKKPPRGMGREDEAGLLTAL